MKQMIEVVVPVNGDESAHQLPAGARPVSVTGWRFGCLCVWFEADVDPPSVDRRVLKVIEGERPFDDDWSHVGTFYDGRAWHVLIGGEGSAPPPSEDSFGLRVRAASASGGPLPTLPPTELRHP